MRLSRIKKKPDNKGKGINIAVFLVCLYVCICILIGFASEKRSGSAKQEVQVPPPPFSEDVFPCSDCHDEDMKTNPMRRAMKEDHEDIVLKHDEENRWCLDCHSAEDRDKLKLANGKLLDFKVSYKLCGQCHGTKLRDWKAGVHGKRTGNWDGKKQYLLCAHCHNPHQPAFKPIRPLPAPLRPDEIK